MLIHTKMMVIERNIPHELRISPNSKNEICVCNLQNNGGILLCRPDKWPLKNGEYSIRWYCYNCQKYVRPKRKE